jgi:hypothetical protein
MKLDHLKAHSTTESVPSLSGIVCLFVFLSEERRYGEI